MAVAHPRRLMTARFMALAAGAPAVGGDPIMMVNTRASPLGLEQSPATFTWSLEPHQVQTGFRLVVKEAPPNSTAVVDSGMAWTVGGNSSGTTACLPEQRFATGMWDAWSATPIWAQPGPQHSSSGGPGSPPGPPTLPTFVHMYANLTLPPGAAVYSALAFVYAEPPPPTIRQGLAGQVREPKLLGAYKLFVDGVQVAAGPGRAVCDPEQGQTPPCTPAANYDTVHPRRQTGKLQLDKPG
eukprot:gene4423-4677_t